MFEEPTCGNRTIYAHDCLNVLSDTSAFPDECINLIYLDPPFNSKSKYNLPFPKEYRKQLDLKPVMAFNDTWTWGGDSVQYFEELKNGSYDDSKLANFISLTKEIRQEKHSSKDSMSAYLVNMAVRLKEMRRVLKENGSIYLHCDPTASHYLKLLMDVVFGKKNFRNEIVWCYSGGGQSIKDFPKKHDVILRYTKTNKWIFNLDEVRVPYDSNYQATVFAGEDTRAPGKTYTPHPAGKIVEDWWRGIPRPYGRDHLGYPTQKPVKLLERIIKASSNKDDIVLDPYCGCGTTVHAAEKLGRQWIGIDISQFATGLIRNRLVQNFSKLSKSDISINGSPLHFNDAKSLASRDRFEFEKWVCGEIGAEGMYHAPGSRGADGGVDGIIRFYHTQKFGGRKPKIAVAIVQVKSGKVTPNDVKALAETVRQHKRHGVNAVCGIFICFKKYMQTVFNNRDPSKVEDLIRDFDFIQPISVEDMMHGKKPDLPGWQQARRVA